jgi:hypothetical protein
LEPRSRTWKHPARLSMRNILYKPTCWSVLRESWSCFTPIPPQPSSSHTQSLVFIKSKSLLWTWHSRTMQRQLGFHGIASLGPDQPPNHALAEVTGTSSQKSTTQQVSASGGAGPSSSHQQQPQSSGSQSPPPPKCLYLLQLNTLSVSPFWEPTNLRHELSSKLPVRVPWGSVWHHRSRPFQHW